MKNENLTLLFKAEPANLQQKIMKIYDHLYANSSTRTPAGICSEVGMILHTGMFMEEVHGQIPAFKSFRYNFSDLLSSHGNSRNILANTVKDTFHEMNLKWLLYEPGTTIHLNDFDLCYTCAQLSEVSLSDSNRDVFGDAIEIFRSEWAKRSGGQFFTDQRVTTLAMVLLGFDPRKGDDLVDICAGTGGFLLAGLNHIKDLLRAGSPREAIESRLVKLAVKALLGQEVDREVCEVGNATLNARLGGGGGSLVSNFDSLKPGVFDKKASLIKFGSHLCAASNPPFGTKITVKDPETLRQFDLAKQNGTDGKRYKLDSLSPRSPDILCLERNIQLLKPGKGRLAIILPYQLLSGPDTFFVRYWLLKHAHLIAVIDLPAETFQPHTGTKTALVVVKRNHRPLNNPQEQKEYDIFMSMPRWIGHDRRGTPIYRRTPEGRTSNEILTDFPQVARAFQLFLQGKNPQEAHELSFQAKSSSITRDPLLRINALFHKPAFKATVEKQSKLQKTGWKIVKLKNLVKDIFYPGRFKRNYVDYFPGAVPFLGGSNVMEFIARTDKWLRPDDPNLNGLRVFPGWILITRSGTTGIVFSVPKAWEGFAMSEHVIRIVPDTGKINAAYLLVFLRSEYGQEQLARGVFGSVIDEITPNHIGEINVPIPISNKSIKHIVEMVSKGEQARQVGIENFTAAVRWMNDKLSI